MPPGIDARNAQRRPSTIIDDTEPLLAAGGDSNLYRTISRESRNYSPPHHEIDEEDGELVRPPSEDGKPGVWVTLSVMLVGVFVSQADWTFVLATYSTVASEFHDLSSGSWMLSVYILAQCAVQPLYGKLSDIYGRKSCLQVSYVLFTVGTAGAGLAWSMDAVIAFRAVQGAGGAGMVSMVSIIITDLVPMNEVASLRSYVNVLQTVGRSAGGVIGGLLTESIGWRWAFLCQVPFMVIAMSLVQWRLEVPVKSALHGQSRLEKLKRVDFFGAFSLCLAILGLCSILEIGGQNEPWSSPIVLALAGVSVLAASAFCFNATRVQEPIFPLRLMAHYDVVTNYLVLMLQCVVQTSLMMSVPLYFQSTGRATTAETGLYLIPAFVGNTLGGLFSGWWIKRTGRFKLPTVLGPTLGLLCMALCLLRWTGHTNAWESLYILPGGLGMGIIASSAFVGLAAGVSEEDVAVAGSGMYLCLNIGTIVGASAGSAVYETALRKSLQAVLSHVENGPQIIGRLLEDIGYLHVLDRKTWLRAVPAYVNAFHATNILGLGCAGISVIVAISTRGRQLSRR